MIESIFLTQLGKIALFLLLLKASDAFQVQRQNVHARKLPLFFSPAIVGASGGVAEAIAVELIELSQKSPSNPINEITLILDKKPSSPTLLTLTKTSKTPSVKIVFGDLDNPASLQTNLPLTNQEINWSQLLTKDTLLIAADDEGDPFVRDEALTAEQEEDEDSRDRVRRLQNQRNYGMETIEKLMKYLPTSLSGIVCATSITNEQQTISSMKNPFFKSVRGTMALKKWTEASSASNNDNNNNNNIPCALIRYGKMTGGIPGKDVLPFLSLPMNDPIIHPSYRLNTLLCSTMDDYYYSIAATTLSSDRSAAMSGAGTSNAMSSSSFVPISSRDIQQQMQQELQVQQVEDLYVTRNGFGKLLAHTIIQMSETSKMSTSKSNPVDAVKENALVISIGGPKNLDDRDCQQLTQQLLPKTSSSSGVGGSQQSSSADAVESMELLRLEFSEISRIDNLISWLVDSWFPQALIEANAAIILQGARPVRAIRSSPTSSNVKIMWEDLKENDLSVISVGYLEIVIAVTGQPYPYLSVRRYLSTKNKQDNSGRSTTLPGERQLIDKLIEGINTVAYKKKFVSPLTSSPV
jgi:hypothetical protein